MKKLFVLFSITTAIITTAVFLPSFSLAANLYWVGDSGANFSVASNWKTTNPAGCGSGDASAAPGSLDVAIFDADCDYNVTMNADVNVAGININSGYTGTISPSSAISIAVGTSDFVQADGVFTSTSGTMTLAGADFTKTGGTFNEGTGTISFTAGTSTYDVATTETFHDVVLNKDGFASLTISSGDTMVVSGDLTLTDGEFKTGTIDLRGNATQQSGADSGTTAFATLDFGDNSVAQT